MVEATDQEKKSIKWQAPEFHFYEKSGLWFSKFSIIAILLIIIFIYLGIVQKHFSYYLAAGVVLAATLALFSQARVKPEPVNFHLTEDGIEFLGKKHLWENLKNFWVSDDAVYFESKNKISIPISMPLGDQDANQLRNYLLQYLPEKSDGGEMLFDKVNKLFKF
ncbi:MAG: hypothetical protein ACD_83C00099G0005 [uncultured bacterium]|uniref:YcxB-like protein domain-containing protein n=1 Tax=Berkelbacteria bacterium GW2011_GWA2_38_9 TaxID=1618334 RepID=A0A0G0PDZ6_9BACT|nr:MAG: hypothetical protein ACD_83C00099G0005 [uncultured bacterium]KKQ87511.1 MAG: hypothetical protein UT11_C0051G0004 [Berkelbacteria bacterium GW2011_GWA2_38_9]